MIAISIVLVLLGILLVLDVSKRFLYLMIYPLVGAFSFVGWPACLYVPLSASRCYHYTSKKA